MTRSQQISLIGASALILLGFSSLKHELIRSNSWDLGIFDQAEYLISRSLPPISSFTGFHMLADHAAWILYPIALLYWIYPTVYWLLGLQAIALASGAWPVYRLAQDIGVKEPQAIALMVTYLLYPLIFNLNVFDFHPDVLALPAFFWAILAARQSRLGLFCGAIAVILGCKAVFALTVAAMGIWLWVGEKRRTYGAIALAVGIVWFLIATQWMIPAIGGPGAALARHLNRYGSLGGSFPEIALNLVTKPWLLAGQLLNPENIFYLVLLIAPLVWGLRTRYMTPMIAAVPQLAINLLADSVTQKNLVGQYSLPILPFLLVSVMMALVHQRTWITSRRAIILWACVGFAVLAKYSYFTNKHLTELDTWSATRAAIAQVPANVPVLTTSQIAPHLTHRPIVKLAIPELDPQRLSEFDAVLLNLRHPGWLSSPEFARSLAQRFDTNPRFQRIFQQDDVILWRRSS